MDKATQSTVANAGKLAGQAKELNSVVKALAKEIGSENNNYMAKQSDINQEFDLSKTLTYNDNELRNDAYDDLIPLNNDALQRF